MTVSWAPELGLGLSFGLDGLSTAMLVLVGGAAVPILFWTLLSQRRQRRLAALLSLFVVAIAGLFTATDTTTLFVAWEITSVLSYLLVGHSGTEAARRAARSTLLVTGAGGVILLIGLLLVGGGLGMPLAELTTLDAQDAAVRAGAWLVLLAAMTKSAQVPLHGWLTGAWTAPTAASALLHAATLVVAGVYIVARLAPGASEVPGWTAAAMTIGLVTFVWGQWSALRAVKAKTLLAATTSAQLGLALAAVASGTSRGAAVGVGLLLVHGAYKAALFLTVGNITARTDRGDVAGLWDGTRGAPALRAALVFGALTLAGLPPLAGWATKEAAVAWALSLPSSFSVWPLAAGSALGVVVAARLVGLIGVSDAPAPAPARRAAPRPIPAGAAAMPLVLLATVAVTGILTGPLDQLADRAAMAVAGGEGAKIVLWPGLGTAFTISIAALVAGAIATGIVAATGRSIPATRLDRSAPAVLGRVIDHGLTAASRGASIVETLDRRAVVGIVAGSLVLLMLTAVDPTSVSLTGLPISSGPMQLLASGVVVLATFGVVLLRRRLAAAVVLGVVGYGLAGLFAVHGAPDLVLTQVVVETIVVIAFVGVLGRRPREAPRRAAGTLQQRIARLLVAVGAAAVAAALALRPALTGGPRELSVLATEAAKPIGAGTNVVNVILTDFRALDTVGELAVLMMAGLAALPLLRRMIGRASTRLGEPVTPLLAQATPMLTRIAVVLAIHLLLVGHDAPGGGFVAGLTLGAGLALHQLATGRLPAPLERVWPASLLGAGMLVASTTMLAPTIFGAAPGDMGAVTIRLAGLAEPKLTTALALDIGVVLIVVGLVLVTLKVLRPGHIPWPVPVDSRTQQHDVDPDLPPDLAPGLPPGSRPGPMATSTLLPTEPA
ncbi:MAG: multicomponent Na+:H+ antiporter subunit A [Nonlabens sp.]